MVLGLCAAWWLLRSNGERPAPAPAIATTSTSHTFPAAQTTTPPPEPLAWQAQPGAPKRRVAGRVTFEGQPVAGARVRLQATPTVRGSTPGELRSGPDGRFDFGLQLPRPMSVSAVAAGRAEAHLDLDLRDPGANSESLELRLRGCEHRLFGRVLDAGGGVIARARVRGPGLFGPESDANGQYELCLPAGYHGIRAEADGYGAMRFGVRVHRGTPRDVQLTAAALITGRVVGADDGAPIADAVVTASSVAASPRGGPGGDVVSSGLDGRFELSVAPAEYQLWATAADGASARVRAVALGGRASDEVVLRVRRAGTLQGRVMRGDQPVGGARVQPVGDVTAAQLTALSQRDGSFELRGVPAGTFTFRASPWSVVTPTRFVMPAGDASVELQVKPRATVTGTVRSRDATPVPWAEVSFNNGREPHLTTADAEGRYQVTGLAASRYDAMAYDAALGGFGEARAVDVADGEEKTVDLTIDNVASISGRVVSERGEPVSSARVVFTNVATSDVGLCSTDADGRFDCDAMTGGDDYRSEVFPNAQWTAPYPPVGAYPVVRLEHGHARVRDVVLRVKHEQLTITGAVVDATGAPVPDARIRSMALAEGQSPKFSPWWVLPVTASDGRGAFEVQHLTAGSWALEVTTPEGAETVVSPVRAGSRDVRVTIAAQAVIEGTLVGFTETPSVLAVDYQHGGRQRAAELTPDGFRVVVPAGTWAMSARTPREGAVKEVTVTAGGHASVTLASQGSGALSGVVLDAQSGQPASGLMCFAFMIDGDVTGVISRTRSEEARSDGAGRFVIEPIPAGAVQVWCVGDGTAFESSAAKATVPRDGRVQVVVKVARSAK